MKKFIHIIIDVTIDAINNITYFMQNNLMTFANILSFILPYIMFFVGQKIAIDRGYIAIGGEILIPLLVYILKYYLVSSANKIGKGITVPVPNKRFTELGDEGEVSIENERLQEMILYMADLEDWLQKKGML